MKYNKAMLKKVETLRKQLKLTGEVAGKHIAEEQSNTKLETERALKAIGQLNNVTHEARLRKKAMKIIGTQLHGAQAEILTLKDKIASEGIVYSQLTNAKRENEELRRRLESEASSEASESQLLSATQQQLQVAQAKIKELKHDDSIKDVKLAKAVRQRNFLRQREVSAEMSESTFHKQNLLLKNQVATFNDQLLKDRANISQSLSKLQKVQAEFQNLRDLAGKMQKSQHEAESIAKKTQSALQQSEIENKQLSMKSHFLERQVDQQRQAQHRATQQLQQVLREEDAVKGGLQQAQTTIMLSQGQYADGIYDGASGF